MRQLIIRAAITTAVLVLLVPTGVEAQQRRYQPGDSGSVRFLFGEFQPDCDSLYWNEKFLDFTGSPSDLEDWTFLMDYRLPISYGTAILFGAGWYEGATTQAYRDYVDAAGREIRHKTSLQTFETSAAWVFEFGQRRNAVTPYIGLGVGFLWYELVEQGDFIDFSDDTLPIFSAAYATNDTTYELFAVGGLDIRIGHMGSLVVQARWREADDELGGSFAGFGKLDLSGTEFTIGFAYHF